MSIPGLDRALGLHAEKQAADYEANLLPLKEDPEETFSDRLRAEIIAIREASGLSRDDFALKIGMSRSLVQMFENGKANYSMDVLDTIDSIWGLYR